MEYLYLAITCFFFSIQFIFHKYFERRSDGSFRAGLWCALANALCMLLYLLPANRFQMEVSKSAWICSLLYAAASLICTGVTISAMRCGKLAIVTTYTLLGGLILPFVWGIFAYQEAFTFWKGIGLILLIFSMFSGMLWDAYTAKKDGRKTKQKEKGKSSALVFHGLCMLLFLTNGIISIATTASQKADDAISSDAFLLLCLVEIAAFSLMIMLIQGIRGIHAGNPHGLRDMFIEISNDPPMTKKNIVYLLLFCALHSICNGIGNIFSLNCAQTMDASIQFPVISAVVIVMGAALGRIFFGEKIEKRDTIGLVLSALGIVCFIM